MSKGFDAVIGNPPYIFIRGNMFTELEKSAYGELNFKGIESTTEGKARQKGKINTFPLFLYRSHFLMNGDGVLGFITPNNLLRVTIYDVTRRFMLDNYKLLDIVDLKEGIFQGVTASTVITILKNQPASDDGEFIVHYDFDNLQHDRVLKQSYFRQNPGYIFDLHLSPMDRDIFATMQKSTTPLLSECEYGNGIVTRDKDEMITDTKESDMHKPMLEGKDFDRYQIKFGSKYILYDPDRLHRPREERLYTASEKLIIRRISGGNKPLFTAYDDNRFYTFASTNVFLPIDGKMDLKLIMWMLNSTLINYYFGKKFTNRSQLTVNISKTIIKDIPLKHVTEEYIDTVIMLVDTLIFTHSLELDEREYLYDLSDALIYEHYLLDEDVLLKALTTHMKGLNIDRWSRLNCNRQLGTISDVDKDELDAVEAHNKQLVRAMIDEIQDDKLLLNRIESIHDHEWVRHIENDLNIG